MAATFDQIISALKKYPFNTAALSSNSCVLDQGLGFSPAIVHQYILGVTPADPMSNDKRHYEINLSQRLSSISPNVKCLAWPFQHDEMGEMEDTLRQLLQEFGLEGDAHGMIENLKPPRNQTSFLYIVTSIISIPIISST